MGTMADLERLEERLERYLSEHGLKHTRQRETILRVFASSGDHLSLDELLQRVQQEMPGVGYATVYRTMKLFTAAGVAHERQFGDGQTRYEPVTVDDEHHDHLICVRCGRIYEFDDPLIERRQDEIARERGMRIVSHRHDIWVICCGGEE